VRVGVHGLLGDVERVLHRAPDLDTWRKEVTEDWRVSDAMPDHALNGDEEQPHQQSQVEVIHEDLSRAVRNLRTDKSRQVDA
jgi:hypothetical protein